MPISALQVLVGIEGTEGVVNSLGIVSNAFMQSSRSAVAAYSSYEDMQLSLTALQARALVASGAYDSLSAAQREAAQRAGALQSEFEQLAILSPFSQEGITRAFQLGNAMGFSTEQSQRLTRVMIDTAAGTAGGIDLMQGATLALGQAWQKGRFQSEEALQLVERGIPAWQYLADNLQLTGGQASYTVAELQDLTTRGLIPADRAIEAIVTGLERDFAGAAERSSGTVSGLGSSFRDLMTVMQRTTVAPIVDELRPEFEELIATLQDPATLEAASAFGQNIAGGMQSAINAFQDFREGIEVVREWNELANEGIVGSLREDNVNRQAQAWERFRQYIDGVSSTSINVPGLGISEAIQRAEEDVNNTTLLDQITGLTNSIIASTEIIPDRIRDAANAVSNVSFVSDTQGLTRQQEEFRTDARASLVEFLQSTTDEQATHAANLAQIEQEAQDRRMDAYVNYQQSYRDITTRTQHDVEDATEGHASRVEELNERFASNLSSIAEQAAESARDAFSGSIAADVSFVQDSRDRLDDFNKTRETIQRQGAWACYVDSETEALLESEEQAARAYVQREAEQSAHLGRMLADRATALALQNGIQGEALNQMTAGIRAAFGVQASVSDLMFDRALVGLDQWAAAGGRNTNQVIAGFSTARDEAVRLTLAQEELTEARVRDIVAAYSQGSISEQEYLRQLQAVPGQVTQQLGLTVSGPIDSRAVEDAAREHHSAMQDEEQRYVDRLEDIQIAAYQDRKDALEAYHDDIATIDGDWYAEQQEAEKQRHENHMTAINEQYQDELQAHLTHLGNMTDADRAYLEHSVLTEARQAVAINANATRAISAVEGLYRQDLITYEELITELQRIAVQAATLKPYIEKPEKDVYYPDDIRGLPRRAAGGPVDAGQAYVVGEEGWEVFMPRTAGYVYPQGNVQGGRNVVVNIYNPSVRHDGDIRAMRVQVRGVVEDVLNEQVNEIILAG